MGVWRQELGEPFLGGGPCHIGLTLGQKKNPGFSWLNRLCPIGERAEKGGQVLRDKSGAAPYSHTGVHCPTAGRACTWNTPAGDREGSTQHPCSAWGRTCGPGRGGLSQSQRKCLFEGIGLQGAASPTAQTCPLSLLRVLLLAFGIWGPTCLQVFLGEDPVALTWDNLMGSFSTR